MVFLDQPVGTGYSREGEENRLYLAGESYAGVYIPHFAQALLKRLDNPKTPRMQKYNLKGLAIGNGFFDPLRQEKARDLEASCKSQLEDNERIRLRTCHEVLLQILEYSKMNNHSCINRYDIRLHDPSPTEGECGVSAWPTGVKSMTTYLGRSDVRAALNVGGEDGWRECNYGIGAALADEKGEASYKLLPSILSRVSVTLFKYVHMAGFSVFGGLDGKHYRMIEHLEWGGGKGMGNATLFAWSLPSLKTQDVDHGPVGTYQSRSNLTNIVVFGASHMASVDAPEATLMLVERTVLGFGSLDEAGQSVLEAMSESSIESSTFLLVLAIMIMIFLGFLFIYALLRLSSYFKLISHVPSIKSIFHGIAARVLWKAAEKPEWHELSENDYEEIFVQDEDVPEQSTSAGVNARYAQDRRIKEAQIERQRGRAGVR
ncbi:Cell death protease [Dinochytrium kinnereticum]|nr:Cell death protease [Dinochytrium kinnereticum]